MAKDEEQNVFEDILAKLISNNTGVTEGPMMSSPGIKYKNKVFAFYYDRSMVFRLGNGFDIASFGVNSYKFLNPFKNKPAMKGWFVVPASEINNWTKLANQALENLTK